MDKILIREDIVNRDFECYLKPQYIYLPFCKGIKINTYIYKDDLVGNEYSPISGFIRGSQVFSGNKEYYIIENDYKERRRRSSVNNLAMDSFINIDKGIRYLVINAIDIEPYVYVRRVLIKEMSYKILDMLDNIMKRYDIHRGIIAISDEYSYELFNTYLGTYPKIKIIMVNNYYPVSDSDLLLKELSLGKRSYVMEIECLMDIFKRINTGTFSDTVMLTIGGNTFKKSINVKVKRGTLLRDLFSYLGYDDNNCSLMRGGPLRGIRIENDNVVINNDDYAFMIFKGNYYGEEECILCGRCSDVCPKRLVPVFIMNNMGNKNNLKKLGLNKCMDCGLCSYVCPAKINIRSYIDKARDLIEDE